MQISEAETPLHRLETVYRRAMERLSTADASQGAFRPVVDGWFYGLEEEVLAEGRVDPSDAAALAAATEALLEKRLSAISRATPQFALALRGYRRAQAEGDAATADGLIAWLAGQPHVGAAAKKTAGIKGEVDHFAALSFLQGLLTVLRDSGYAGLVLVLDEIETLQRVRGDVREKGLNALRQLVDEVDAGRFPGLYLVITGTPAFYDGPQGVRRLEPLAQRLHVDFQTDARFDNPRAVQVRLPGFDPRPAGRGRPHDPRPLRPRRPGPRPDPGPGRRRLRRRAGPAPSPATWAARSASPPGCSSRSWSATCSTASTSTPTSTRAGTTA